MGVYVTLNEYNNIEGMIQLSELSRKRIRSINKLVRVGKIEACVALRVDKERGYIDLSKKRIAGDDLEVLENKYNMSKSVHSIMTQVSIMCKVRLIKLYKQFCWDLYKRFGHAYNAFKRLVAGDEKILDPYDLRDDVKSTLLQMVTRRLTPQPVKIRADIEVTCFAYEGIDAVKAALRAGQKVSTEDIPIKIQLVAPPLYVMFTTTHDQEKGIAAIQGAVDAVTKVIKSKQGNLNVKRAPRVVSQSDERALERQFDDGKE